MMTMLNNKLLLLLGGMFVPLIIASIVGAILSSKYSRDNSNATIDNLNARIRGWWGMCIICVLSVIIGPIGSVLLFASMSFFALREFFTLTPTRRSDHEAMFWCFFIFMPLQYVAVGIEWYGVFSIFIPVYVFLFLPARIALAGDTTNFLERTAKIQWGMLVAVFCISHAPALLMLDIPGYEGENVELLLFLMIVVQMSDVLQYVFGKLFGKHPIVPKLSPNKTVEGFVGGILVSVLLGMSLYWVTPFSPWEAGLMSLAITLMGFIGGLCMSAIKRDSGIKDFGEMIEGHGGMLDRIDSLCFAAPVFFHLTRYFYT
ncbi:phosphatidate cytidylyltransferase [Photorhabdus sp. HUG-39]|uniref:Phosphatidate cytidylyltransferase n=2 Tax=Photorhabdus TaxID=29487 RepID=A0ABX0B576_9GAMM|nr:phosphatidate cytidylyltransferase [Photorhabdus kayaii]RAW95266.1 phosphatidate cytidylyltransferase [Photorhabdus sp. S9-53]RAW95433.1 phosphatidate cytidylyltransferase [Photorhabdus sp. S10-54]RAW98164.1 phosphatidate cytidylyltransferase [Photorhabdus sp. S8-52]RAX08771.1 phosphatidate cytidylyltransferase [Photorhabdus sp. HUG-39]